MPVTKYIDKKILILLLLYTTRTAAAASATFLLFYLHHIFSFLFRPFSYFPSSFSLPLSLSPPLPFSYSCFSLSSITTFLNACLVLTSLPFLTSLQTSQRLDPSALRSVPTRRVGRVRDGHVQPALPSHGRRHHAGGE